MAADLPFQETQRVLAAHVRDPGVNPPPVGIEDRRLAIYRDLIYRNIESFLSNGFPILHSILEEDHWRGLVRDFIASHKSHSPYFLEISREFLQYLQDQPPAFFMESYPFGLELAHYEWVELALDVSTESLPNDIPMSGDLLEGKPVVSPLAWRLSYRYPVHLIGEHFRPAQVPAEPTFLIVYRDRKDAVRFMTANAVTLRLLQLLEDDRCSGRAALVQIAGELGNSNTDAVLSSGLETLQQLCDLSVICGVSP